MDCADCYDSGRRKQLDGLYISHLSNTANQKALYFPDVAGKSLATGETLHTTDMCVGRVSVISMLSTKISEVVLTLPGFGIQNAEPTVVSFPGFRAPN